MKTSNANKPLDRACGVLVFSQDGQRILLAQRGPEARHEQYKWEGPGGKVEDDETFEQATIREFREELGIEVRLEGLLAQYDEVEDSHGTIWEAEIFRGSITETPIIQEPTKCVGYGWFTRQEIVQLAQHGLLADYSVKDFTKMGWL